MPISIRKSYRLITAAVWWYSGWVAIACTVAFFIALSYPRIVFGQVIDPYSPYPLYSPTFPQSGVINNGGSVSTYTTGESVTDFGGVYFLGGRRSCAKIGNGFICN